jgi:hypothetical protein
MELLLGKSSPRNYRALRLQNKLHAAAVATAAGPSEKALGHATQGIEMPKPGKGFFVRFSLLIALFQILSNMVVSSKGDTAIGSTGERFQ